MPHDTASDNSAGSDHRELIRDLMQEGAIMDVEQCEFGQERLSIRFDLLTTTKAIQLFIRYRVIDKPALLASFKNTVK